MLYAYLHGHVPIYRDRIRRELSFLLQSGTGLAMVSLRACIGASNRGLHTSLGELSQAEFLRVVSQFLRDRIITEIDVSLAMLIAHGRTRPCQGGYIITLECRPVETRARSVHMSLCLVCSTNTLT